MSAIRAGMVSVVPLTIIGGCFMIVAFLPIAVGKHGSHLIFRFFKYP
jgi:cellobiose-specific phosphotransferase system component IIC